MNKFTNLTSTCMLIRRENIDTDQIIPAKFLKTTQKTGLGAYLFYNWRYNKYDKKKKVQQFDSSNYRTDRILIVGGNFGCGSSREHAVWTLMDFGFRVIISSSFADIFYNNSLKNGLLPIILKPKEIETVYKLIKEYSKMEISINLAQQTVTCHAEFISASNHNHKIMKPACADRQVQGEKNEVVFNFPIDNFRKTCLLNGLDELDYILFLEKEIKAFEMKHKIYISF